MQVITHTIELKLHEVDINSISIIAIVGISEYAKATNIRINNEKNQ